MVYNLNKKSQTRTLFFIFVFASLFGFVLAIDSLNESNLTGNFIDNLSFNLNDSNLGLDNLTNITLPDFNQSQDNQTELNVTLPENNQTELNVTLPENNQTAENQTELNTTIPELNETINETIESNLTNLNESIINETLQNQTEINFTSLENFTAFSATPPTIDFTTPLNGTKLQTNNLIVNVSTVSSNGDHYVLTDLDNSLVGWWRMEQGNGTFFADNSSNNLYHAICNNTLTTCPVYNSSGKFGGAYTFNGSQYLMVSSSIFPSTSREYSISLWFNSVGSSGQQRLWSTYSNNNFFIDPATSSVNYFPGNASHSITALNTYTLNNWTHVVFGRNSTYAYIYVNGARYNKTIPGADSIGAAFEFGRFVTNTNYFNGSMDEIMIFNRTLSQSEVNSLYNASAAQYSNNFTNLSEGRHNFKSYTIDSVGNLNQTSQIAITSSAIYPIITPISPTQGSIVNTFSPNINVSINHSISQTYAFFNDGLVGWWRMDNYSSVGENSSLAYDWSGNGNKLICAGATCPTWTSVSQYGNGSYYFNSDTMVTPTGTNFSSTTNSLTLSAWVRHRPVALGFESIIGLAQGSNRLAQIDTAPGGTVRFRIDTNQSINLLPLSNVGNLSDGNWHHVAMTYNGTTAVLYFDYSNSSFRVISGVLNWTTPVASLGFTFAGTNFNGEIDEAMIFNRSLGAAEIQALYNSSQYGLVRNLTLTGLSQNLNVTAVDITGKANTTTISFLIDTSKPSISFIGQTPYNQSKLPKREIIVNMSSSASNRTHYVLADFDNSLVGWWRLDNDLSVGENSTKIMDWSTRRANLTARGNITPVNSGVFGRAYQFEGDGNDFLANQNGPAIISQNISMGGWFYNTDSSEEYYLCLNGAGSNVLVSYFCLLKRAGVGTLWTWNNSGIEYRSNSTGTLNINQWNHVFATYENRSNVKIYVNGKLSYDLPSKGLPVSFNSIYLGSYVEGSGQTGSYLNGSMDEVMIFNRSLSQLEVSSLYNASAVQYYNNFTNLIDGNHTIAGYAVDTFGNLNQTQFSSTTNTPFLNLVSPTYGSVVQTPFVSINFTATKSTPNRTYSFFNDGLVGWWGLDNNTLIGENGTLLVNEAKGSNGTCSGTTCPKWNSSGSFGGAYLFDGSNDYFNIPSTSALNSPSTTNSLTVSAWVFTPSTLSSWKTLVAKTPSNGAGWVLYASNDRGGSRPAFSMVNGLYTYSEVYSSSTLPLNQWNLLTGVYHPNNTMEVYLNGQKTGSIPNGIFYQTNNQPVKIGCTDCPNSWSDYYTNHIDEVMIFNRSLSQDEIKALYNSSQYGLNRIVGVDDLQSYIYNVTVIDVAGTMNTNFSSFEINLPPEVTLNSPLDSVLKNWSQNFDCSASDGTGLSNITLYIWNETDEIYKNTRPISGLSNSTNWDFTFDHNGNYLWNCQAFDSILSTEGWASNQSFVMDNIFITLSWLNESNDLLYFHYNNSLMLNLTCDSGECSEVNVSLYRFSNKNLDSGSYINHDSGSCGGTQWSSRRGGPDAICDVIVLSDNNFDTFYGLRSNDDNYIGFYFSEPKEVQTATSYWTGGTYYLSAGFNFEYYNDSDGTWIAPAEWNYTGDPYSVNTEIYLNLSQPVFTSAVRLHKAYYYSGNAVGLAEVKILGKSIISEIEGTSPLYMNESNIRSFSLSPGQGAEMNFNVIPEVQSGTEEILAITSRSNGRSETSDSKTFTYTYDSTPPSISFTNNPWDTETIDPDTSIFFNATISDSQLGVRDAVLEYYNGTIWQNLSMVENISNLRYQANLTTQSYDTNYTVRVYARDMFGNSAISQNRTIYSWWDCNWSVSPFDFGAVAGFDENKESLNLTILNIGDAPAAYNCSLRFRLSYSLPQDRIYFDGDSLKPSNSYNIEPKQNQTISVSAVFLSENLDESLVISADEVLRRSLTRSLNSTGRVISTTGGPYLFEEIKSSKVLSLNLTATNFSIEGTLKNIVGDGSDNNTAYNVIFNWTLPAEFGIDPINSTLFFDNLSESNLKTNRFNISLNRTNLVNLAPKSYDLYLYALGYSNTTGTFELINHAGNQTILSEKVVVSFACVSESDGLYIPACGPLDGDYVAPTPDNGRGGSGGAGGGDRNLRSQATFELVRGKDNSFQLEIKNTDETSPLTNVTAKVSGINSQYIIISPSVINEIAPLSSKNLTIKINAPSYFSQGNYTLFFDIEGFVTGQGAKVSYSERKVTTLFILDIDKTDATDLVSQIVSFRNELNQSGLNDKELVKLISSANQSLRNLDFVTLQDLFKQAKLIHDSALEAKSILTDLRSNMNDSLRRGLTVIETEKMVFLAQTALARGDYSLALERLREAKLTYALEVKGEFNLVRTITNNPLESTGIALGAIAFTTFTTVAIRLRLLKRKRRYLEDEEKLLLQLMKVVQIECFEKKSLSMEEYDESMRQYENRLSEAIAEKIKVDTKIANILKIRGKNIALAQERAKIIELIKKAQDDYMNKGTLETRVYENMLRTYSGRLAEVEEQLAFFDVQRAIKSQKKGLVN
jgi:hypothetical protein